MKILAAFLGLVFLLSPAVGCAQDDFDLLLGQINKVQRELQDELFGLEMRLKDQQEAIQNLETRCQKLEDALKDTQAETRDLRTMTDLVDDKTDDSRKRTNDIVDDLLKIEDRLKTAEDEIQELKSDSRIPPHPASREAAANKPKAPVNKPKPAVKEGTH